MKPLVILATLLLVAGVTQAKKLPGYVVFPNNDTLRGDIKISGASFLGQGYNPYDAVAITDSTGRDSTYQPGEVIAFGFTDKSGEHIFRAKMHRDSTIKFQQVIVLGPKASLYYYEPNSAGGYGSPPTYFTFERADGAVLFLKNYDKLETFQNKIKVFYGEAGGLGQFIDERFTSRWKMRDDIKAVVMEANRL
ncbi:hypothetical protein [Puia sp.]|uniref:hypothetical protein n=1 Tax=Puia sp. TaxID=2045100 RepID=UPI002F40C58D